VGLQHWEHHGELPLVGVLNQAGQQVRPVGVLNQAGQHGHWQGPLLELSAAKTLEKVPGRLWYGFMVSAGDDTKVHRSSPDVWGTCTFHEYTARSPNRASTVRAHNWVVLGALLANPKGPAHFLPTAGRLYFRQTQLPAAQKGPPITFRTKPQLLVEMARSQAKAVPGKHLLIFDGGFAVRSTVRPLRCPDEPDEPRIDFATRLRHDARLHALPAKERHEGQCGRTPVWGKRLPPPRQGGRWRGAWQSGSAFVYGQLRLVKYKEVLCQWRVLGHDVVVKAVVAKVEGYRKRFTLACSATELSGLQIVELFCARFRQEDGFRDLKGRLGWEECRAWTRNPIERTTQALFLTMLLLRLLQFRLQEQEGDDWWLHPPWNKHKSRPSVLDVERLLRQHRGAFLQGLADWLQKEEKAGE
jgi:hypothetical protein